MSSAFVQLSPITMISQLSVTSITMILRSGGDSDMLPAMHEFRNDHDFMLSYDMHMSMLS